ncbi:MAG TPA: helix-turn-helix transcriptional regulator [Pseudonocardia sp.]|uniref:helix-turn-helix domain-containing protein n=1 Tax=Pseudonocardia sp. TaxID=60912 RepID=UPI002F4045A9
MDDATANDNGGYDDRTIGRRLRHIRQSRKLSLTVVAGLAGTSASTLSRIENGILALDSRKLVVALAKALRVAPSDLTRLPVPAPANGHTDSAVEAVRGALMSVAVGRPGGQVQPVGQLRQRYQEAVDGDCAMRGTVLPSLIADMHTTLAQRQEMVELLPLTVLLHGVVARNFLYVAAASMDLRWQDAVLARQLAEELGDPIMLGIAARGASSVMLGNGRFDLARDELDATTVPTATNEGMQLSGMLALERSIVTAAQSQTAESAAALDYADELAVRTTGDAFALGFSPVNVGMWRMAAALECGEPDEVIRVAQTVNPQEHPYPARRAAYWADYGRALTSVRRRDEAARALLRAEKMHPVKVLRNSFARDSLAELVAHSKDDALGREIRGMAYRAGLPV